MKFMFCCANKFNNAESNSIGDWDVSCVREMVGMFDSADFFNQNIGSWNVSNVIDMSYMFNEASNFNQDIGSWDISSVTSMNDMFCEATEFNNAGSNNIGLWDVSKVTNMEDMFNGAYALSNEVAINIIKWPINQDCNMENMFNNSLIDKEKFKGKLYGNKIAEYFNIDNPNEFMVWEPYTRWQRRKNIVMFFSQIAKIDLDKKLEGIAMLQNLINHEVYKNIILFL